MSGGSLSDVTPVLRAGYRESAVLEVSSLPASSWACVERGAKPGPATDAIVGVEPQWNDAAHSDEDEETRAGTSNGDSEISDTDTSPRHTPVAGSNGFLPAPDAQTDLSDTNAPHGRIGTSEALVDEDARTWNAYSDISDTETLEVRMAELSAHDFEFAPHALVELNGTHEPHSLADGLQMVPMAPVMYALPMLVWVPPCDYDAEDEWPARARLNPCASPFVPSSARTALSTRSPLFTPMLSKG